MYKYLVIVVISLFFIQDRQETILWSTTNDLEWDDFKANPDLYNNVAAVTASGLSFQYSTKKSSTGELIDYNFNIEAHFFPKDSWYKKESVNTTILNHERLHFDITELFARQFRKKLATTKFSKNIDSEIKAIYRNIKIALSKVQNQYDNETNHSRNLEKQKEWEIKINSELQKLADYNL